MNELGLPDHVDTDALQGALDAFAIETPSWGYGDSGTRFKTFPWPGAARTVWDKVDDAAHVHALTGAAPSVALHIPWDRVDDYAALRAHAEAKGVRLGAINPNLFQDDGYRLGSICNPDPAVRTKAHAHLRACGDVMRATGSRLLSLWLADGTNYAGQDDLAARMERLEEGLRVAYEALPGDGQLLIEYKLFEPAFYHTDLPDWGTAFAMALRTGERARVLVDMGHHALGTNVSHIVAFLLRERRLGGFHFNARRYADDDLVVGSDNPFELFDLFTKIVAAGGAARELAYMIDQSHAIEDKLEAMIDSVTNCQTAYAKALLVDRGALARAQAAGDVLGARRVLTAAFETDVRPLLRVWRERHGRPADPITAHRDSGYGARVANERGVGSGGGGYPTNA